MLVFVGSHACCRAQTVLLFTSDIGEIPRDCISAHGIFLDEHNNATRRLPPLLLFCHQFFAVMSGTAYYYFPSSMNRLAPPPLPAPPLSLLDDSHHNYLAPFDASSRCLAIFSSSPAHTNNFLFVFFFRIYSIEAETKDHFPKMTDKIG